MKLLIISHTPHYLRAGQPLGWGPTVREIDQLASIFAEIIHLAVLYPGDAPASSRPYLAENVRTIFVRPAGGETFRAKVNVFFAYPQYWQSIWKAIDGLSADDCVHVRCPANISLLALLVLFFSRKPRYRWVKYAGNWRPAQRDDWSYRLQRSLLAHNIHRGLVTINGHWPRQPAHILSFHNPSLDSGEVLNGQKAASQKELCLPLQFLFVGALHQGKGVFVAIEIATKLHKMGLDFEFHLVGDGPERATLENLVKQNGLAARVKFHGWVPREEMGHYYQRAHFLIFPSRSEGWPKVLSEGMAYGVVPLAGAVSSIPQILAGLETGRALSPLDDDSFVQTILEYWGTPSRWYRESKNGTQAASHFTYDAYLERVRKMFQNNGGLELPKT